MDVFRLFQGHINMDVVHLTMHSYCCRPFALIQLDSECCETNTSVHNRLTMQVPHSQILFDYIPALSSCNI